MKSVLPYKTAVWFHFAKQSYPDAKFYLKTDDDSYIDADGLENELSSAQADFWGRVHAGVHPIRDPEHKWFVPESAWGEELGAYPDYHSGAGYALSRHALDCYVSKIGSQNFLRWKTFQPVLR